MCIRDRLGSRQQLQAAWCGRFGQHLPLLVVDRFDGQAQVGHRQQRADLFRPFGQFQSRRGEDLAKAGILPDVYKRQTLGH